MRAALEQLAVEENASNADAVRELRKIEDQIDGEVHAANEYLRARLFHFAAFSQEVQR